MTPLSEKHIEAVDLLTQEYPGIFAEPARRLYADLAMGESTEPQPGRWTLHRATEALEDFVEPESLLSNRMHFPGTLSVLAADGGTGKSYFMLYQCMMVALTGRNALYIDEENGDYLMKKRIKALAKGLSAEIPENLLFSSHAGIDIREPGHIAQMYEWIQANNIAFIVLDSLSSVMAGADENSSKDMKPPLMAIHKLANDLNVCIVAIHHTNKNGGYRGSTAIKGEVDSLFLLTSQNNGQELAIKTEKFRDGPPFSLNYSIDFTNDTEGNLYSVTYTGQEAGPGSGAAFSKSEKYVLRFLAGRTSGSVTEIMAAADTCTDEAARRSIYSLTGKGYTKRINEGVKGTPSIYALTEKGRRVSCEI